MAAVTVQITTLNNDHFMTVEEDVVKEIAMRLKGVPRGSADPALLKRMSEDLWKAASSTKVSATSEVDYVIVLDGMEDEESWGELLDAYAEEDDS